MSHVVSSQPSATSPYQPTAISETGNEINNDNPKRILRTDSEFGQDDCCIHTRNRSGICLFLCTALSMCCQGIKTCTESCCDYCANCLNDCCEDKPRDRDRRNYNLRYKNSRGGESFYDNAADNNDDATWGITSVSAEHIHLDVGNDDSVTNTNLKCGFDSPLHHTRRHDSTVPIICDNNFTTHRTSGQDTSTHNSHGQDSLMHHTSIHDSSRHPTSGHDSSTHPTSGHDSSTNHTSGHDSSTHPTSGHDSSTNHTSGHDSSTHPTSGHDSSTHLTSGHDSSTHCTSGHDSSTHYTSHDSGGDGGGGGNDSGGGCDSGGGGGCDSGGACD